MSEIKYPIGIQTFSEIIRGEYLYVDKTAYAHSLVNQGKYYFLSRPRRFGKSLLLSTLDALFRGRRELFRGLAIDSLDWDWEEYPVMHFDFSGKEYTEEDHFDRIVNESLSRWEEQYGCEGTSRDVDERFRTVIRSAYEKTGKQVVILVDEYDQPLLKTLHDDGKRDHFRSRMQTFYSVMKTMDSCIKFGMLTGVTRFSKVSVFSGLNNLNDISLDSQFNSICGISEKELQEYFAGSIADMAASVGVEAEELHSQLKRNYDGYHFSQDGEDIYNPFSLLNTFYKRKLGQYWYASGTPTFLVKQIERSDYSIPELDECHCTEGQLTGSDVYLRDPVPLLYQTGYLTIKGYDSEFMEYILGYPNREVAIGFAESLLVSFTEAPGSQTLVSRFVRDVRSGRADDFMKKLQSFTADISYDLIKREKTSEEERTSAAGVRGSYEAHYQNVMYVLFKLMGFYTHTEYKTSNGRIDMTVETPDYLYLMEFKIDGSADEAMKQIDDKEYALAFRHRGKRIIKIGASFDTRSRRLSEWKILIQDSLCET